MPSKLEPLYIPCFLQLPFCTARCRLLLSPHLPLLPVSLLALSLEAQSQNEPLVKITHFFQVPGTITAPFIIASDAFSICALKTLTVLGACDFRGKKNLANENNLIAFSVTHAQGKSNTCSRKNIQAIQKGRGKRETTR